MPSLRLETSVTGGPFNSFFSLLDRKRLEKFALLL
jgi:hypothetical protein